MDSKIIDGKALALQKELKLKSEIGGPIGKIIDYCNYTTEGAEVYLNLKVKKAAELGIEFVLVDVEKLENLEEFKNSIIEENNRSQTIGIMIQVPLPEKFYSDQAELINLIDPQKDVDGLQMNSSFSSATGQAVIELLESINLDFKNKCFVVVGSEGVEGAAIVKLLQDMGAEVIGVDKKNKETSLDDIKQADVVIAATGQKELITADMVKEGVIAVDVGLGEFAEDVYQKASYYTPKTGGVGPMTIICLMENALKAFKNRL